MVRIGGIPLRASWDRTEAGFARIDESHAELRNDGGALRGWVVASQAEPAEWHVVD